MRNPDALNNIQTRSLYQSIKDFTTNISENINYAAVSSVISVGLELIPAGDNPIVKFLKSNFLYYGLLVGCLYAARKTTINKNKDFNEFFYAGDYMITRIMGEVGMFVGCNAMAVLQVMIAADTNDFAGLNCIHETLVNPDNPDLSSCGNMEVKAEDLNVPLILGMGIAVGSLLMLLAVIEPNMRRYQRDRQIAADQQVAEAIR